MFGRNCRAPAPWRHAATRSWTVLVTCLAVGCQVSPPDIQPIEESKSIIHFEHAGFDPELASYYVQREPGTGNSLYLLSFSGTNSFATLAAMKTGPSYVIEERATERYITSLLGKIDPDWGDSGRTLTDLGPVSYRMFRLPGPSASCVGFMEMMGQLAGDERYGRDVAFGYLCQDGAGQMSAATAEELISKVSLTRAP
jgi:hypothetical protein